MNFTQFQVECISMFSLQIKTPKMKSATNSVSLSGASMEGKTHSQKKRNNKDRNIQAQTELIAQQKWEIENLKAAHATRVSPKQLVNDISQAMSCLYAGSKKTHPDNSSNGGRKFVGTPRPS